jgi:hypothetical protein
MIPEWIIQKNDPWMHLSFAEKEAANNYFFRLKRMTFFTFTYRIW